MILYTYRISLMMAVLIMTLAAGYMIDLRYLLNARADILKRELELKHDIQIENKVDSTQPQDEPEISINSLSLLLNFLQRSAITPLEVVRVVPVEVIAQEQYQFILQVNYQQLIWLLTYLQLYQQQWQIQKFLLSVMDKQHLKIDMLMHFDEQVDAVKMMPEHLRLPRDPFCDRDSEILQAIENKAAQVAVNDLQFLGMSVIENKAAAIFLYPDGRAADISLQTEFGKEHAKLTNVTTSEATIMLPDKSLKVLRRFLPEEEKENK